MCDMKNYMHSIEVTGRETSKSISIEGNFSNEKKNQKRSR